MWAGCWQHGEDRAAERQHCFSVLAVTACTQASLTQEAGGRLEVGGLGWGSRRQMWHAHLCRSQRGVVDVKARLLLILFHVIFIPEYRFETLNPISQNTVLGHKFGPALCVGCGGFPPWGRVPAGVWETQPPRYARCRPPLPGWLRAGRRRSIRCEPSGTRVA